MRHRRQHAVPAAARDPPHPRCRACRGDAQPAAAGGEAASCRPGGAASPTVAEQEPASSAAREGGTRPAEGAAHGLRRRAGRHGREPGAALRRPLHRDLRRLGHPLYRRPHRLRAAARAAARRAGLARAEVAHTIALRRRKGTAAVLEQLARDVTGWNARAVEYFQLLGWTQYMNHIRPRSFYAPDMRRWEPLARIGSAFDSLAHTVDVRRIESRRGRFNIPNVGIFLWRLNAYRHSREPGAAGRRPALSGEPPGPPAPALHQSPGARTRSPISPTRSTCRSRSPGARWTIAHGALLRDARDAGAIRWMTPIPASSSMSTGPRCPRGHRRLQSRRRRCGLGACPAGRQLRHRSRAGPDRAGAPICECRRASRSPITTPSRADMGGGEYDRPRRAPMPPGTTVLQGARRPTPPSRRRSPRSAAAAWWRSPTAAATRRRWPSRSMPAGM